ncbi:MAG: hypothetical protein ACJ74Y_14245 [Bryobacteraceae bacterium]|jgi:ABC-type anion transport system duplicated permease subunit
MKEPLYERTIMAKHRRNENVIVEVIKVVTVLPLIALIEFVTKPLDGF